MMRFVALREVGGFDASLIAGEEPELCLRLRRAGWTIWRIDVEMTLHDVAMIRFSQWWTRSVRAGHAYAEGAAMHGADADRYNVTETRRALSWGVGVPLTAAFGATFMPQALAVLLLWPAQVVRLKLRGMDWVRAFFLTLGKLPEAQGVIGYHIGRLRGRKVRLIEYK
jgi:GT2 family glycosyltransferase